MQTLMDKMALETEREKENLQREYNDLKKKHDLYVLLENWTEHYENLPMQYTENFMKISSRKILIFFLFLLKT